MTVLCPYGEHRVQEEEILHVKRMGGGNYNRPSRWQKANICRACATRVVATATPGHESSDRYSVSTLRFALGLPRAYVYRDPEPHPFVRFQIEAYGQRTVCVNCGRGEGGLTHPDTK